MIFKINPAFVLPRWLPARSLGCLSACLFIVPIWSRINFTPLFVSLAVGVGGKRRGVKRDREGGKGEETVSRSDGEGQEGESGLIPEEGERRFVFLSLPVYREAFISNPQSPPVINHNWTRVMRTQQDRKQQGNSSGKKTRRKMRRGVNANETRIIGSRNIR